MICIMHQAEPYGHLVVNGHPIDSPTLARMVGGRPHEVARWLSELDTAGVCDMDGETRISRRMVRDERVRKARAEGGKLGGNPALKDNHKVEDKVNHDANLPPTPSSSISSSTSLKPKTKVNGHAASAVAALTLPDWVPKMQWDAWIDARRKRRNPPTDFALRQAISKLEALKAQGHAPGAVLAQSAFRGWAGLFPVKDEGV